jgi:hypothetical protein
MSQSPAEQKLALRELFESFMKCPEAISSEQLHKLVNRLQVLASADFALLM